jgi:hypothetical protein
VIIKLYDVPPNIIDVYFAIANAACSCHSDYFVNYLLGSFC